MGHFSFKKLYLFGPIITLIGFTFQRLCNLMSQIYPDEVNWLQLNVNW